MNKGTITEWNRLESRPRKEDFSRALRAEIRDPLWMMTRQWQMGELTAEDTGSPVTAKIYYSKKPLTRLQLGEKEVINYPKDLPLETVVERENIQLIERTDSQSTINDISLSLAISKRLVALIEDAFNNPRQNQLIEELRTHEELQYEDIDAIPEPDSFTKASMQTNLLLKEMNYALLNRTFHGGKLYAYIRDNRMSTLFSGLSASETTTLDNMGNGLITWFDILFNQIGKEEKTAWHSSHLEYQFALSAPDENGSIVLDSLEYHGGRLDWYSSDKTVIPNSDQNNLTNGLDKDLILQNMDEVFPAEIEFTGMPHNRWWEFEDGKLNFGKIQPKKSDLSKILFAEFGFLFANDWSVIPLNIDFGSIAEIREIIIKDTFGQYTIADHYKNDPENASWSFIQTHNIQETLENQNTRFLFIPPVVHDLMSSEPLEKINFVRDEMANMVWGIETIIPNGLGSGTDGNHMARQLREYYNKLGNPLSPQFENDAKIKYKLVTEAPENWIPFIAKKISDSQLSREIQLQRANMPRIIDGIDPMRIEPRTSLLLKENSPYYIFEEEIAKSGTFVSLQWQRTRMATGKTVVWLGRKRMNGRGEVRSNLAYDQISPKLINGANR